MGKLVQGIRRILRTSPEVYNRKLDGMRHTVDGREVPDPTPMAPPVGFHKQPSLVDQIRQMVRDENTRLAMNKEAETFEEADDFDVDDDPHPVGEYDYEENFEPPAVERVREKVNLAALQRQRQAEEDKAATGKGSTKLASSSSQGSSTADTKLAEVDGE